MRQAASQIVSALENTDAPFDTGVPMATLHEPGFVFMVQTSFGAITALRQNHLFHTQVVSQLFIRFGEETAIATSLARRLVEGFEMRFQTGFSLLFVAWVTFQDAVVAHQATFDFIEPDFVSVFHRMRLLATPDDIGMLFKDTHNLFWGGNLFALQDSASGLLDHLLGEGHKMGDRRGQSLGVLVSLLVQLFFDLHCRCQGLFRESE